MPDLSAEQSFDLFQQHEASLRANEATNEATTRLRAIDTLLFDVLGWDKVQVECEKYSREAGFADYAFMRDQSIAMIVEAKRSGVSFVLPEVTLPDAPVGFGLLAKECPDAEKALRQALGYAALEGARYIAITNGHQWILTLTFVANQRVDQRSAYVFESLDAIRDRKFRLFHSCFSPQGVFANKAANGLLESRKAPAPAKLSASIPGYPAPADRNVIANELYLASALVLEEVRSDESDPEFLENCYVVPRTSSPALDEVKEIVVKRLSLDQSIRAETYSIDKVPTLIESDVPEKPLIVLGKVGHGKTTFLRYLRKLQAPELLSNYIQIDVDFLDRPDTPDRVGAFIHDEIEKQLRDSYHTDITADEMVRGFLHVDMQRFGRSYPGKQFSPDSSEYKVAEREFVQSILQDKHAYLAKVFQHLKKGRIKEGKGHSVALFLDNLDRRSDGIQEEAFLRASAMARDWSALVFICLRPGTFHRSRRFGVLDSVAPRIVAVTSPPTRQLVPKRLKYAKRIALGLVQTACTKRGVPFSRDVSLQLPSIAPFLDACADSFERNTELSDLFSAVSNGNARDLLAYVHKLLTSMHLNTKKIMEKVAASGYIMPEHEALRALLYGDFRHYDPEQSVFINLFDITRADPSEHFTRLLLLRHLGNVAQSHPHYGHMNVDDIEAYMCQIGFSGEHVRDTLRYLFEKGCVDSRSLADEWSTEIRELRLTDRGRYMVNGLVNQFNYIDAVSVDTPIVDAKARDKITDVWPIYDRLERGECFLSYLDHCSFSLQDASSKKSWSSISEDVRRQIADIRMRL